MDLSHRTGILIMKNYEFANITVRPFLKLSDVNNPYIFGETKHVINMCDYREPEVIDLIHSKGGTFDWFPTEEQPMDVNAILQAVAKLAEYDKDGTPIIVHCMGGNNRSRTVVEAYHFAKTGTHLEDMYRGYMNHLHYNCESGYLPPIKEMERLLARNMDIMVANITSKKEDPRFWLTPEDVKEMREEVAGALKYIEKICKRLNNLLSNL